MERAVDRTLFYDRARKVLSLVFPPLRDSRCRTPSNGRNGATEEEDGKDSE